MIGNVLSFISDKLNEYLGSFYDLPETLVALGTPGTEEPEEGMNRMLISECGAGRGCRVCRRV